jgi:hypothetical protein
MYPKRKLSQWANSEKSLLHQQAKSKRRKIKQAEQKAQRQYMKIKEQELQTMLDQGHQLNPYHYTMVKKRARIDGKWSKPKEIGMAQLIHIEKQLGSSFVITLLSNNGVPYTFRLMERYFLTNDLFDDVCFEIDDYQCQDSRWICQYKTDILLILETWLPNVLCNLVLICFACQ